MKLLVIKLGALGDFIQALGPMDRIRRAHPNADITLLTTPAFEPLAKASGYFDHVETDGRPKGVIAQLRLCARLRRARYDRVYDLQTSSRSSSYFRALWPRPPEWSGVARGCSHPHRNPDRDRMHTLERQAEQLRDAGVWPDAPTERGTAPTPDLGWMLGRGRGAEAWGLAPPYALLIPGGSAARPEKRWPAEHYGAVARLFLNDGYQVGVIGGPAEPELASRVLAIAQGGRDLSDTDLFDIAALAAGAAICIGNDTGPTHLAAVMGAPTLALFSQSSDPDLCAPRGRHTAFMRQARLSALSPQSVHQAGVALMDAVPAGV